jgi:hypothetical protein
VIKSEATSQGSCKVKAPKPRATKAKAMKVKAPKPRAAKAKAMKVKAPEVKTVLKEKVGGRYGPNWDTGTPGVRRVKYGFVEPEESVEFTESPIAMETSASQFRRMGLTETWTRLAPKPEPEESVEFTASHRDGASQFPAQRRRRYIGYDARPV